MVGKNMATLEHAVLVHTAYESLKGHYVPGADRVIAEVKKKPTRISS